MIQRLDHMAISVRDLDASIAFYSRHFGLEHYFTQQMNRPEMPAIAYLRSGQGVMELMHRPTHQMGGGFHFCFVTDDFDAEFQRLTSEGVAVRTPPHPTAARVPSEAGWLRATFDGPDGEEVELRGPGKLAG